MQQIELGPFINGGHSIQDQLINGGHSAWKLIFDGILQFHKIPPFTYILMIPY